MQTIKKYANRKLYHTNRKQYITLDGIAALIQAGEQVQVVDNETGEDITAATLAQVIVQARSGGRLPIHVLAALIQAGGDRIAGVRRSLWLALGGAALVDAEIGRRLAQLRAEGALSDTEALRLRELLLRAEPRAEVLAPGLGPTASDLARLGAQVDALTAAVEQLLAARRRR
jgi:polyhydroxyalkanoate synthesis repressor PhaR